MTTAERNIADRLQSVAIQSTDTRDKVFINQLKNWHDRTMTNQGRTYLLQLLTKYQSQIPESSQLRSAYINEQLKNLAP